MECTEVQVIACVLWLKAVLWEGLVWGVAMGIWHGLVWWLAIRWLWLGAVTGSLVGLGGGGV
jgi:hypothetical protein